MGAVTPPAYRASHADNTKGAQENHKALTCQITLIQAEHIQKTPAIERRPIPERTSGCTVMFLPGNCRTAAPGFLQKHKDPQRRKGFSLLLPLLSYLLR
ncbi:hypothetical protein PAMP_007442 [Pampus punctatissimus]